MPSRLPLVLKLVYTSFVALLVPVYWHEYGPTNFLYFCDMALLLTLVAVWAESSLLVSISAVGILLPQTLWVADFAVHWLGFKITGLTDYMFNASLPLFLRSLSLFHGWLPFLLLYLLFRLGYDKRALLYWCAGAWLLMLISYFLMPKPGAVLANPQAPVNINYVYGIGDQEAQHWMPALAWLALMMVGLPAIFWWPTHLVLQKWLGKEKRA